MQNYDENIRKQYEMEISQKLDNVLKSLKIISFDIKITELDKEFGGGDRQIQIRNPCLKMRFRSSSLGIRKQWGDCRKTEAENEKKEIIIVNNNIW